MAKKTMNLNLVKEMTTNYQTKQLLSILTNTVNPMTFDAKSVWFDLESLKAFIAEIEYEVAQHPQYGLKNFGLRFYYSAYPENDNWGEPGYEDIGKVPVDYEKLHTLIAIPTAEIDGKNQDFDPSNTNTYNGSMPSGSGMVIMAENHGDLSPPNPAGGLWF